jgi:hypothetical protein
VPLPVYTTIYTTIVKNVTNYVVTKYRIVSEIVTELTVDYYDPDVNTLYTSIKYPTYYVKAVYTTIVGVETRTTTPVTTAPPTPPRGAPPTPTGVAPTRTRAGLIVAT